MAYIINRYNGNTLATVEDGTINQTTDLKLVGKNYAGYGEIQNENFVHLLENFSGTSSPPRPLSGQIWFNSATSKLQFYDGSKWRTTGGAEVAIDEPAGLTEGDFWWKSDTDQLYAWNGTDFVLIGPQGIAGAGKTQMVAASLNDTSLDPHAVLQAVVDDQVLYIISTDEFTLDLATTPVDGFTIIKKGITLREVDSTGVSTNADYFWGTAGDSLRLGGFPASEYVRQGSSAFTANVEFADIGLNVGDDNDLKISVDDGNLPTIRNQIGNKIRFGVRSGDNTNYIFQLDTDKLSPGSDNRYDMGDLNVKWKTIYAYSFNGTATQASGLWNGSGFYPASVNNTANNIVARNANGDIYASIMYGTATAATYADLAERYEADAEYEPGTVVVIGGDKEITQCVVHKDAKLAGVISTNPAHLMNADAGDDKTHPAVALKGRIPCKVVGPVKKGDLLVTSANPGHAIAISKSTDIPSDCMIVGKSLVNDDRTESRLVEIMV
jgi:hypothetical protein